MQINENEEKKLSIIIPCYRVEKYLERCLDSLTGQSVKDIELICINDGSPDRCPEILRDYETRFPELIRVIHKENEGGLGCEKGRDTSSGRAVHRLCGSG
ncbi:MAG: glycosyltransferase [Lachnospiraceae bacterium]|nr:glycosyltransferase [Lachnospiraceae bacterium]